MLATPSCGRNNAIRLTGRARMDHVESIQRVCHCVSLMKFERVMFLRLDVDADDFKARAMVAHRSAASATKKIKQFRFHNCSNFNFEIEVSRLIGLKLNTSMPCPERCAASLPYCALICSNSLISRCGPSLTQK